jgi:hypothetical protein
MRIPFIGLEVVRFIRILAQESRKEEEWSAYTYYMRGWTMVPPSNNNIWCQQLASESASPLQRGVFRGLKIYNDIKKNLPFKRGWSGPVPALNNMEIQVTILS